MYDGKISNNNISGGYSATSTWSGYGGGVDNSGVFEMFGGEITHNTAGIDGGGVYGGTFAMYDGKISDNTANRTGGGVYGTVNRLGGTISGNNAPEGNNVHPIKDNELDNKEWLSNVAICACIVVFIIFLFGFYLKKKKIVCDKIKILYNNTAATTNSPAR